MSLRILRVLLIQQQQQPPRALQWLLRLLLLLNSMLNITLNLLQQLLLVMGPTLDMDPTQDSHSRSRLDNSGLTLTTMNWRNDFRTLLCLLFVFKSISTK